MDKLKLASLEMGVERDEDFYGAQVGAFNVAVEAMYGAQVGAFNVAVEAMYGAQVGAGNIADRVMYGAQVGGENVAGEAIGAQVGVFNIAREAKGAQVGALNFAEEPRGTQVGLVDIVIKADRVLQVGGICIIASNPWYAKCLPLVNYGGSKEKREIRERKKRLKAEALKREIEELKKEKFNVRV